MALALNLPNLIYVYLAYARPPIQYIYILFAVEQFGYGLGFSAFMVFLMSVCKGRYKTAHFAISTGLMAMGMMLPGMASGYLQKALGYPLFFILICLATIPGMIAIFFIPLNQNEKSEQSTAYS
jgi:PAT family beta-lactamase induction signal transducer AmpG